MAPHIKNCGLSTAESIDTAIATGASFIGFVYHAASPRHLTLEQGKALRDSIPQQVTLVAVMVAPDDETLEQVTAAWKPDMLQIHAATDTSRLQAIKERFRLPLILGWPVATTEDIRNADAYRNAADYLLLDKKKPGEHGGTGESFNWEILDEVSPSIPWFLAGGLTPENVAKAINGTAPFGVDVSSGIESSPGVKSLEKIAAFNRAVLDGAHEQ